MGKKQDAIYKQLLAAITKMQNPASNPAQNYLTNEAMAGAEFLKKGEFKQMPKGMFFNFDQPADSIKRYNKIANVGREGTFALGDTGGSGKATELQSKFIADKFARDESQNYQNNIAGAAGDIRGALGQAAGAQGQTDQNVISAYQNLLGSPMLNKPGFMGSFLGLAGGIGSSLIGKMKPFGR